MGLSSSWPRTAQEPPSQPVGVSASCCSGISRDRPRFSNCYRSDWPRNEPSFAVWSRIAEEVIGTGRAKRSFERTNARLTRIRRQRLIAMLASRPEFKTDILGVTLSKMGDQWFLKPFSILSARFPKEMKLVQNSKLPFSFQERTSNLFIFRQGDLRGPPPLLLAPFKVSGALATEAFFSLKTPQAILLCENPWDCNDSASARTAWPTLLRPNHL